VSDLRGRSISPSNESSKRRIQAASLLFLGVLIGLPARDAFAGSRSSLVFVSVRVVESCRVDAVGRPNGSGVDLSMRCNSAARPSVAVEAAARAAGQAVLAGPGQPVTTVSGAQALSSISLPAAGTQQVLRIDF
jgi:hypothetical protein